MNNVFRLFFSLSMTGSILILILLAAKPFYKNRLGKSWQYYIWLAVIARFLIPFTLDISFVDSLFSSFEGRMQTLTEITDNSNKNFSDLETEISNADFSPPENSSRTDVNRYEKYSFIFDSIWLIWLVGVLILLIRKITIYQSFVCYIKAGRAEVSNIDCLTILAEISEEMNLKKPIEFYTNSLISSPMLIGFFSPFIVLPDLEMDISQMRCIIKHELIHYKRFDMFYKWLVQITICLHWFNPFVYLMGKEINRNCELACDEAVIKSLDKSEKKLYGDTLLSSLKSSGQYKETLFSVTLSESAKQVKERLGAIMNYRKKSKLIVVISVLLTLFICTGAAAMRTYTAPNSSASLLTAPWLTVKNTQSSYTYSQALYYQQGYLFDIGWNLDEKASAAYPDKTDFILSDLTAITISFDKSCKDEIQSKEVLSPLKELIEKLKFESLESSLPLERPLILSITYIGSDISKAAEDYYKTDQNTRFSALFSELDNSLQKNYLDRMFEDNKNALFSANLKNMDSNLIDIYAQKAYQENNTAFFANIVPYLSNTQKQAWILRTSQDNRNNFLSILKRDSSETDKIFKELHKDLSSGIEKPFISVEIYNGGAELLPVSSNELKVKYNSEYYDVQLKEKNGEYIISISGKTAQMGDAEFVQLYIPDTGCSINVNVTDGSFAYSLPNNFKDSLNITAKDSSVDFTSKNQYQDCSISITASEKEFIEYSNIYCPNYFIVTNQGLAYQNGTAKYPISVLLTGYTNVNFTD